MRRNAWTHGADRASRAARLTLAALLLSMIGCSDDPTRGSSDATVDASASQDGASSEVSAPNGDTGPGDVAPPDVPPADVDPTGPVTVIVTLDDTPVEGAVVIQGGTSHHAQTGPDGSVSVTLDPTVVGDLMVIASHQNARQKSTYVSGSSGTVTIALTSLTPGDNAEYTFEDPGEPERRNNTSQCGHCHRTINDAWFESPHRTSASNPKLHAQYADLLTELNADPVSPTEFGACADCHAPGIDGPELGGRDLRDAEGRALDYGVHCDICHKTESIDLDAPAGVAGRLRIHRPTEKSKSISLGLWQPVVFGPHHDAPNIRMGNVQRDHFKTSELCAGCHELWQPVLVPGAAADTTRWPDGRLPIHTTYSEWKASGLSPAAPCQSCHMPPDPKVWNTADLQLFPEASVGLVAGWFRAAGSVRRHSWIGPRQPTSGMLELAADVQLALSRDGDELVVAATTRNVGPGHALPTGEPMRSMVLQIEASCGNTRLPATGGDAVPDFGGHRARQTAGGDWTSWPTAAAGDRIRVVALGKGWHDYEGFGPFGDGTFDDAAKGMPKETVVGEVEIVAVAANGTVALDEALPAGDVAYLVSADDAAGAPGFGFARVLAGPAGERMVPHYRAVDVVSDNRLLPGKAWLSSHRFAAAGCDAPAAKAVLTWRQHAPAEARQRGWDNPPVVMREVAATLQPPSLPEVPAPVELTGNVVELTLRADELARDEHDEDAEHGHHGGLLYAYNGQVPGPEIRATVGDRLVVTLENATDEPTTIHWHGLHVPYEMDGVTWQTDPIAPGETFVYTFDLLQAGTFWYHPHFDTAHQVDGGLFGALVVSEAEPPEVDEDLVLIFDLYSESHDEETAHAPERFPQPWRVNGELAPTLDVPAGSRVRGRLINVANHGYLALGWPGLRQVGGDQGLFPTPLEPDAIRLGPGQRAEVEWLVGDAPIVVETLPYSQHGGETYGDPATVLTLGPVGTGAAPAPGAFGNKTVAPTPDPGRTDIVYVLQGSDAAESWLINGERFPDVTVGKASLGDEVILEVRNLSPTRHPFHTHGHAFEILSVDGVPPVQRTMSDTIDVGIRQVARLRFVATNPGAWMVHCHILGHAERGMMTVLEVE